MEYGTHPSQNNKRNEDTRSQPLEQNIGQGFKDRVRDEEDRKCSIILVRSHIQIFGKTRDLRISDVGPLLESIMWGLRARACTISYVPIQEGDEVQQTQPGNQAEIQLPQKLAIL
jgi:hypothetical protein